MNEMKVPYVRTGYEYIMAVKGSDKYCKSAPEDGKVISVGKTYITVEYKSGKKEKYKLGKWTINKEDSGKTFIHETVPNLREKEKFSKDDTICYDKVFYEKDIFYPKKAVMKMGTFIRTALTESMDTYEDSSSVHESLEKD